MECYDVEIKIIKSCYQRVHVRLLAEDVLLYLLANPHIRAQHENEKVYDVVRHIQIYDTMEQGTANYESAAEFTDFFMRVKLDTKTVICFSQRILDCFHPDNILQQKYYKRLCKYYFSKYQQEKDEQFEQSYELDSESEEDEKE